MNSLGWRQLRPLQDAAIESVLGGQHVVMVAPTAGGKTEAAVLPLLSRMLEEGWLGLSVLYVCPLRALLNNLHVRLERYAGLLGRRAALWHGDSLQPERDRLLSDPPDILLTTPESLESMLVSRRVHHLRWFADVRAVVIDEAHDFAGDDRGWHVLAVLERITRLAGREVQRVALSATVGNPEDLLCLLTRTCTGPAAVVSPPAQPSPVAEVTVDYVGSLPNAAIVISRLHRGEKRLAFVDSRARSEQLAFDLRERGVTTFVSHGSLSSAERRAAEAAFAEARDCVIVATSTLELGIDVGDLDRMIQVDAPPTVASFLQRLGRTGRRPGIAGSALLLASGEDALLRTLAVLLAWSRGYVEPVIPPPWPLHLVAQQLLALALQESGVGRQLWTEWLGTPFVLGEDARAAVPPIVEHLLAEGYLHEDGGVLGIGQQAEDSFGFQHFMELVSVFTSPPMFSVRQGSSEIGHVPVETLLVRPAGLGAGGAHVLVLGARGWAIKDIDWRRRVVQVEPTDARGVARWLGAGVPMGSVVARCVREVMTGEEPPGVDLSVRAKEKLAELRQRHPWAEPTTTTLVRESAGQCRWWTFAGWRANLWLARSTSKLRQVVNNIDDLSLAMDPETDLGALRDCIEELDLANLDLAPWVAAEAVEGLKFSECLPKELAEQVVTHRLMDIESVNQTLIENLSAWTDKRGP